MFWNHHHFMCWAYNAGHDSFWGLRYENALRRHCRIGKITLKGK